MRKIATLITVAIATVSFSACTVTIGSKPSDEATQSASAPPTPSTAPSVNDERYADLLREQAPELAGVDTDTIIESTKVVCEVLDSGMTLEEVVMTGIPSGLQPETVGAIIGGAIAYECPEYSGLLDDMQAS